MKFIYRELREVSNVPVWYHHDMTGRVGVLVEHDHTMARAFYNPILSVVARSDCLTEDASLWVFTFDELKSPGCIDVSQSKSIPVRPFSCDFCVMNLVDLIAASTSSLEPEKTRTVLSWEEPDRMRLSR